MHKKIIFVFLLLLAALPCYSKERRVTGKVTDDEGKPVARCEIKAANTDDTTYTNARGEFVLLYNADSSHSVIVSCPEYVTKEVRITEDALWVILKLRANGLADAEIKGSGEGGKIKHGTLGKENLEQVGIYSDIIGSESAIFLSANSQRHGVLKDVYFYITKDGVPDAKFRVRVYGMDRRYMPGQELLDSTVILHANTGDEWVKADLSARHILIGSGVFIAIEWLSGTGNNKNIMHDKGHREKRQYNTMVLGMTKGYNEGQLNYVRSNFYHEWHEPDFEQDEHRQTLAPMIYGTYTYYKN